MCRTGSRKILESRVDTDIHTAIKDSFIKLNAELSLEKGWKSITKRKASLPDADDWNGKTGKIDQLER
jgi:hypothetical protein